MGAGRASTSASPRCKSARDLPHTIGGLSRALIKERVLRWPLSRHGQYIQRLLSSIRACAMISKQQHPCRPTRLRFKTAPHQF
ncbi:hypothetical protein L596_003815 [Steinernema carpocapsae]|uniref:Uncharacterized protein n=1 Tax=Steinernema carpocapsae TaxID=34508 RepID=A0A4U8UVF5_STECR|nr:hypothetical protein L596_003815 [Steinernema carpocapsae]